MVRQTDATVDDDGALKPTDALLGQYEDMTAVFNHGERIPVNWSPNAGAYIDPADGEIYLPTDPREGFDGGPSISPANQLRLGLNADSHETEHGRSTRLPAKGEFVAKNGRDRFAGYVWNLVEDRYIDVVRTRRFRGMARAQALFADLMMEHNMSDVSDLDDAEAMSAGLIQVCKGGRVKGWDDASDDVKEFLATAHVIFTEVSERARSDVSGETDPDPDYRDEQAQRIYDAFRDYVPQVTPDFADFLSALFEGLARRGDLDDPSSPEDDGQPTNMDPSDADGDAGAGGDGGGESGGGRGAGDVNDDAKTDAMDDLDGASDDDGASGDVYGAGEPNDYRQPSDSDIQKFEAVKRRNERPEIDIDHRVTVRDRTLKYGQGTTATARDKYDERFADEIVEAFRQFKTSPAPKASRSGHRLNTRNFLRRRMGDLSEEQIYQTTERVETGDREIIVSADMSSSMSQDIVNLKIALAAIADAAEIIGDEVTMTAWSTKRRPVIVAPDEQFEWDYLDAITATGMTPTRSAMDDVQALVRHAARDEKVVLFLTDGAPNGGEDEAEDVAARVKDLRNDGVRVIGMGVGDGCQDDLMDQMFGGDWVRADPADLSDNLIDIYESQLKTDPSGY